MTTENNYEVVCKDCITNSILRQIASDLGPNMDKIADRLVNLIGLTEQERAQSTLREKIFDVAQKWRRQISLLHKGKTTAAKIALNLGITGTEEEVKERLELFGEVYHTYRALNQFKWVIEIYQGKPDPENPEPAPAVEPALN